MFWHKKNKIPMFLMVFGLIALAIILSIAVLLFNIAKNGLKTGSLGFTNAKNFAEEIKDINLAENYKVAMNGLVEKVVNLKTVDEIYQNVEEVFFTVRVPEEKRDAHLQALIKINQLKDGGEKSVEVVREKVMELVRQLVTSN